MSGPTENRQGGKGLFDKDDDLPSKTFLGVNVYTPTDMVIFVPLDVLHGRLGERRAHSARSTVKHDDKTEVIRTLGVKCGHGVQHDGTGAFGVVAHIPCHLGQKTLCVLGIFAFRAQVREVNKRWKLKSLPFIKQVVGKAWVIVVEQGLENNVVAEAGLNQYLTCFAFPTGPATNLHQKLADALAGKKICCKERRIDVVHHNQGQVWEMVPFGQHLGANQKTGPGVLQAL